MSATGGEPGRRPVVELMSAQPDFPNNYTHWPLRSLCSLNSASPTISLPEPLARRVWDLYDPPAKPRFFEILDEEGEIAFRGIKSRIPCDATAPDAMIQIGRDFIHLDPRHLVLKNEEGQCYTAFEAIDPRA